MICVIDSGCGGANIIKECLKYYKQDFIYFVDNKNCPYGDKSKQEIISIITSNINYVINKYKPDLIILGCNTASAIIDYNFLLKFKTPILKTIPPIDEAVRNGKESIIFATKNTLKYSKFIKYYKLNYSKIKVVHVKNLAKHIDEFLAEENLNYLKLLKKAFIFNKKLKNKYKFTENMVLGCTHFKYLEKDLKNIFNNNLKFFYCENNVAKTSKFFVKKNKNDCQVKIELSKPDYNLNRYLKNVIYNITSEED